MRILLVQPPQGTRFGLSRILTGEPLGLECVGGAVRSRGYDAEVVDLRLDSWKALDRAVERDLSLRRSASTRHTSAQRGQDRGRHRPRRRRLLPTAGDLAALRLEAALHTTALDVTLGPDGKLHAAPRRLLEGIGERGQPRLAARPSGKADAEGSRLRLEALRERGVGCVRHYPEWDDDRRVARLGRDRGDARAGEEDGIEALRLHGLVVPARARSFARWARGEGLLREVGFSLSRPGCEGGYRACWC